MDSVTDSRTFSWFMQCNKHSIMLSTRIVVSRGVAYSYSFLTELSEHAQIIFKTKNRYISYFVKAHHRRIL